MGDSRLVGPVRMADARAFQSSYLRPVPPDPPIVGPALREQTEHNRIFAAISAARRLYPAAVAAVLVDTLTFHAATKHRVAPSSMPARLVDELLRPPDAT